MGLRTLIPALVAAIAYVDPGNFAVNVSAGARLGYSLLWVVVLASAIATLVQYLAAKLGQATGNSLAEICRTRYGTVGRMVLWLQAEIVVLMTDLAELVGGALGLELLFGIPLPLGASLVAVTSFAILALHVRGHSGVEPVVVLLLGTITAVFVYLTFTSGVRFGSAASGLLPTGTNRQGILLAVGIIGATIMPHATYLHSALSRRDHHRRAVSSSDVLTRATRRSVFIAMGIAAIVNVAIILVAAARLPTTAADSLQVAYHELRLSGGQITVMLFGVALLASGMASTVAGIYTGQIVMQGFLDRAVSLWVRRLISVLPPLILLLVGVNPTTALVLSQVVLAVALPWTLVPLIRFTSNPKLMGDMVNRRSTTIVAWLATAVVVGLDLYLLVVNL